MYIRYCLPISCEFFILFDFSEKKIEIVTYFDLFFSTNVIGKFRCCWHKYIKKPNCIIFELLVVFATGRKHICWGIRKHCHFYLVFFVVLDSLKKLKHFINQSCSKTGNFVDPVKKFVESKTMFLNPQSKNIDSLHYKIQVCGIGLQWNRLTSLLHNSLYATVMRNSLKLASTLIICRVHYIRGMRIS